MKMIRLMITCLLTALVCQAEELAQGAVPDKPDSAEALQVELKAMRKGINNAVNNIRYKRLSILESTDSEVTAMQMELAEIATAIKPLRVELDAKLKADEAYQAETDNYQRHLKRQKHIADEFPELGHLEREHAQLSGKLFTHVTKHAEPGSLDSETASLVVKLRELKVREAALYKASYEAEGKVLPQDWLASIPQPNFCKGHTLLKLTRYGWVVPYDVMKVMAEKFGYAVQIGGYFGDSTLVQLRDPNSDQGKKLALYQANPEFHRLAVTLNRYFPESAPEGTWTRDADGKLLDSKAKSYDGTEWHPGMKTTISPLAPDELARQMAEGRAAPLRELAKIAPLSIILNGGEYGLGVLGFAKKVWAQDPRIVKAVEDAGGDWFDLVSRSKAREEEVIADVIRDVFPNRDVYVHYTTEGGSHRKRWGGWKDWGHDYQYMRVVSDLPSQEHYVGHFNSGYVGNMDVLCCALNARGVQLAYGDRLAYSWFWDNRKGSDMLIYQGFIKMIYIMGTLGGNAGNYWQSDFSEPFKPELPPDWIRQIVALSRVHALFSYLEDYIRHGDLVPGPYRHFWSTENPAYELLPEELSDQVVKKGELETLAMGRAVRVLARKHREKPEWLVVAWAADGVTRNVTVEIPGAGKVRLQARAAGNVYVVRLVDGVPQAHLCDPDAEYPSIGFRSPAQFVPFTPPEGSTL